MLVATKVKLSMERLTRLNGMYGGKGSGRSPVQRDGRSRRLIDRSRVNTSLAEPDPYARGEGLVT